MTICCGCFCYYARWYGVIFPLWNTFQLLVCVFQSSRKSFRVYQDYHSIKWVTLWAKLNAEELFFRILIIYFRVVVFWSQLFNEEYGIFTVIFWSNFCHFDLATNGIEPLGIFDMISSISLTYVNSHKIIAY